MECKICKTKKGVGGYIIADDLENPQPYCKECIDEVYFVANMQMCGIKISKNHRKNYLKKKKSKLKTE